MLEFLLDLFIYLGCFFYIILTVVMYFFATYCVLNRKKLRLGFSQMPATVIDLIIIVSVPLLMTCLAVNLYYDFNPY